MVKRIHNFRDGFQDVKGLKMILGVLCVIIIGLVVGVIAVSLAQNSGDDFESRADFEDEAEQQAAEQLIRMYDEYVMDYEDVQKKVEELLVQKPIDVDAVIELCSSRVGKYVEDGESGRAASFVNLMVGVLVSENLIDDALRAAMAIDFSGFSEPEQYRQYMQVIKLAKMLGKDEVVTKYEALAAGVKAGFDAENQAIERLIENDDELENTKWGEG